MARLTIEECWWTDPRRSALIRLLGSEEQADYVAIRAWRLAQEFWKHDRKLVPKSLFDMLPGSKELLQVGLADYPQDGFIYVRGSSAYLDWVREKREQAKEAGKKSAEARKQKNGTAQPVTRKSLKSPERNPNETRTEFNDAEPSVSVSVSDSVFGLDFDSTSEIIATPAKKRRVEKVQGSDGEASKGVTNPDGGTPTALAWRAYKQAFEEKYGEAPPWNAKIAGQLRQLCSRMPADEAPDVAKFYLTHNEYRYVKAMHPVGMLLQDAEKLRTEWATGRRVSDTQARNADKLSHAQDQMARIAKGEL